LTDAAGKFDKVWSRAKLEISEHWRSYEGPGLEHTSSNRDEVFVAFERYVAHLKSMPENGVAPIIEAIRMLYSELNLINEKYDSSLLETDERELLVPIIVELAETAGVNPDDYDGEPGAEYRDF
jgi:hypothetical protein